MGAPADFDCGAAQKSARNSGGHGKLSAEMTMTRFLNPTVTTSIIATSLGVFGGYTLNPHQSAPAPNCSISELQINQLLTRTEPLPLRSSWLENPSLMDSSWARWPSLTDF